MYNFKITLNHQKVILNQTVNTDVLFKNFTDQYLFEDELFLFALSFLYLTSSK